MRASEHCSCNLTSNRRGTTSRLPTKRPATLNSALSTLAASSDAARAAYNKGLLHLARREYREALQSFDAARTERPEFRQAEAIARQVRAHLHEDNQP
jgi:hypothetical protein